MFASMVKSLLTQSAPGCQLPALFLGSVLVWWSPQGITAWINFTWKVRGEEIIILLYILLTAEHSG